MNDHQIRCFVTAAEENNFTRAAERLYITQPAISKVITSLERELEIKLFLRHSNKKIELTEAGRLYFDMFKHCGAEFERVQRQVSNLNKTNDMRLRFAYASRWSLSDFLPQVLAELHTEYPNVALEMECLEFQQIYDDLLHNRLDVALSFQDYFEETELGYQPVCEIGRAIVYSDLYIARHGAISSPADFSDAVFYLSDSERDRRTGQRLQEYCQPYGFVPRFQYLRNWDSVVAKVEAGQGVVVFDTWAQYLSMKQFHHIELGSSHVVALAWRKGVPTDIIHFMADSFGRQAAVITNQLYEL